MNKGFLKLIFFLSILIGNFCEGQAQTIQWSKCYGGNGGDQALSIKQTSDGGYLMVGTTNSVDGDVIGNHPPYDNFWILKLDSLGMFQWQSCLGGDANDFANGVVETDDHGYIVVGLTVSDNYEATGNHGNADCLVIKLDSSGTTEWHKCFGGSGEDGALSIIKAYDNSFIISGYTRSNDGDVSGYHGGSMDGWLFKINGAGNLLWQKCIGGTARDQINSIENTTDSGFVVATFSASHDGDVAGNHTGNGDYWIVKLDSIGNIQSQKCYGGSGSDVVQDVKQINDNGFIISGYTFSNDSDVSLNHGNEDCWIIRTNFAGDIIWEKSFGGSETDKAFAIEQTSDGGFIFTGNSSSIDADVSGNHGGGTDAWVVKIDSSGNVKWTKCYGGSGSDFLYSLIKTIDGGYALAGNSGSIDGDVVGVHSGSGDVWVVKLAPDGVGVNDLSHTGNNFSCYFSSVSKILTSFTSSQSANLRLAVQDITGRTLYQSLLTAIPGLNKKEIFVGDLAKGIYIVTLSGKEGSESVKVVSD